MVGVTRVFSFVFFGGFFLGAWDSSLAVSSEPERVISINVCTDELIVALADAEQIHGLSRYSLDPMVSNISEIARNYPVVRGEAEEVMLLKPDLVLASVFTQKETAEFLKRKGITVKQLEIPGDFDGIRKNIREMARILGKPERGEDMIREFDRRLGEVQKPEGKPPRILFFNRGGQTAGTGTFEHAVIEAAGGRNVAAETGIRGHGYMALERMAAAKPDILVFSDDRNERLSLGHEMLTHPLIQKGLPDIDVAVIPSVLLNCGNLSAAEAVERLSLIMRDFHQRSSG